MNGVHTPGCDCDICREVAERGGMPPEAVAKLAIERTAAKIAEYGWVSHVVDQDPDVPTGFNAHTHGFSETLQHPDFQIVLRVPPRICHDIFAGLFLRVQQGDRFQAGRRYDRVIQGYEVLLLKAQESGREVLRIILPDPNGCLDLEQLAEPFCTQFQGTEV